MTESARLEAIYYALLDARPGATSEELHRAYIAKAKTSHPDRFQSNPVLRAKAEVRMKEINAAYDYLKKLDVRQPPVEARSEPGRRPEDAPPEDESEEESEPEDWDDAPADEAEDDEESEPDTEDDASWWTDGHEDAAYEPHQTAYDSGTGSVESAAPCADPSPGVHGGPGWSASLLATLACYLAIRLAAAVWLWSLPILVVAAWVFTLVQGFRNKLVVYANIWDVTLSLVAGTLILAGQLTGNIDTTLIGLPLCIASAIWSIRRNSSIFTGLTVCLFKVTFSPCWLGLVLAPWCLPPSGHRGAARIRTTIFCGLVVLLMFRLVNGRRR